MATRRGDDLSLQYVLSTPSGGSDADEKPLVVVLHGRGADANDLADIAPAIDGPGGYRFLFPNAPRQWEAAPGMTFGYTWFDGWPPVGETFAQSRELVLEFLDGAVERFPTPRGKVVLAGFSQGALMSLDVGFRTKQPIAGIVAMSGALHEADLPPLIEHKDRRVLIVHGTADDVIPVLAARRARRVLEDHGIEPEYHEFPMGHFVTPESMAAVAEFVRACFR